jgi:hypothetical protein
MNIGIPLADVSYIRYIRATVNNVCTKKIMGRKKLWAERLTLPISTEMLERIDRLLSGDEARLDLIREAIDRELKRRERRS